MRQPSSGCMRQFSKLSDREKTHVSLCAEVDYAFPLCMYRHLVNIGGIL